MPRAIDPGNIPAELELARTLLQNEELDEARSILDAVLIAGPSGDDVAEAYYLRGAVLLAAGEPRGALLSLDAAHAAAPGDSEILSLTGEAYFALWALEKAREALERSLRSNNRNAHAHRFLALVLDREGKRKIAAMHFERAADLEPESYPRPVRVSKEVFDRIAREAIEALPAPVKERLGTIGFLVRDYPVLAMLADRPDDADPETLGVFFGEELPARYEARGIAFVPNHIHLFQRNLENMCATVEELEEEIRTTVFHEVGHYLGYDEEGLEALGLD